jgi:hypothetical protein
MEHPPGQPLVTLTASAYCAVPLCSAVHTCYLLSPPRAPSSL